MKAQVRNPVGVVLLACGAVAWSASIMLAQDDARHGNGSMPAGSALARVVDKYCAACHNDVLRSASGLLLEKFDPARIDSSPELWAKTVELFGRQGAVEITAIIGDYVMAGIMLTAVDQQLPPGREALLPVR